MAAQSIKMKASYQSLRVSNVYCPNDYNKFLTKDNSLLVGVVNAPAPQWIFNFPDDTTVGVCTEISVISSFTPLSDLNQTMLPYDNTTSSSTPDIYLASPLLLLSLSWQTCLTLRSEKDQV